VTVAARSRGNVCRAPTSYWTETSGFKLALPKNRKLSLDTEVSLNRRRSTVVLRELAVVEEKLSFSVMGVRDLDARLRCPCSAGRQRLRVAIEAVAGGLRDVVVRRVGHRMLELLAREPVVEAQAGVGGEPLVLDLVLNVEIASVRIDVPQVVRGARLSGSKSTELGWSRTGRSARRGASRPRARGLVLARGVGRTATTHRNRCRPSASSRRLSMK